MRSVEKYPSERECPAKNREDGKEDEDEVGGFENRHGKAANLKLNVRIFVKDSKSPCGVEILWPD